MSMDGKSVSGGYGVAPQRSVVWGPMERRRIETLGSRAKLFGLLNWIVGALTVMLGAVVLAFVSGAERGLGVLVMVLAFAPLLSGRAYVHAGRVLQSVPTHSGDAVPHVLQGLRCIRNALRMEAATMVLGAVVALALSAMGLAGHH